MNVRHFSRINMLTALVAVGAGLVLNKAILAQPGPAEAGAGVEVLTRGPVHEAFAETIAFDPQPGIVVSKAPREIIEEVPPDQRPEGENVSWIPGYWGWDDDRNDYLWVSGTWRAVPPGRQWLPGYWGRSGQGYQWTSGYWADAAISEVEYYPEPPPTVEAGPNIAAPSPDYGWVPGSWVWHQGRYAWRPGYWVPVQPNWVWVPARYVWAPRGYVFVEGYWDYSVGRRGILFAPVYFDPGVYARPGFHYSPSIVIDLAVFTDHLFIRPNYGHYYFGDYYAAPYRNRGFYASFSFNSSRHGYDPIYAHQRWEHRKDHDWEPRVRSAFEYRRDHEDARPVRTLAAQIKLTTSGLKSTDRSRVFAESLDQVANRKEQPVRFQSVAKQEKQQLTQRRQEVQKFRGERQQLETPARVAATEKPSRLSEPAKVKLRRSPIVGQSIDKLDKDRAPPKRPEAPKPDLKVAPRARKAADTAEPRRAEPKAKKAEPAQQPKGDSKNKDKDKDKEKHNDKPKDK
jgi:hypothetical protein